MDMDAFDDCSMSQMATLPTVVDVKSKHINCCIHSLARFSPECMAVIDTPEFQRLRELKQLGLTNYVYPTATHTRFDHSLGVCHLAEQWAGHFKVMQGQELGIEKRDVTCVSLAGLCHDLGHGPFSHVFDYEFLRRVGILDWSHEDMSCKMLDRIVCNMPDSLAPSNDEMGRIKRMIDCNQAGRAEIAHNGFLYDIVANKRNGVDVDKFDYLARDSYFCGVKISFDHKRPMTYSKVLGGQICFKQSEYENLHSLFSSRERMHRQVYTHRKAKSLEFMLADAMLEASKFFRFDEKIRDPELFMTLDDSILRMIENYRRLNGRRVTLEDDEDRGLAKAEEIIRRIRHREIYRFINEIKIPPEIGTSQIDRIIREFTVPSILSCRIGSGGGVRLDPDQIVTSTNKINHSLGNRNPMDQIQFFDQLNSRRFRPISQSHASHMMTNVFEEQTLRLYSKDTDPKVCEALEEAFGAWIKRNIGIKSGLSMTPFKERRNRADPEDEEDQDGERQRQAPVGFRNVLFKNEEDHRGGVKRSRRDIGGDLDAAAS